MKKLILTIFIISFFPILCLSDTILWQKNLAARTFEFHPNNNYLAVDYGLGITLRDVLTGEEIRKVIDVKKDGALAMNFSKDGKYLACGSGSGRIWVWDTETWEERVVDEIPGGLTNITGIPQRRQLCWAHLVHNLRGRAEAVGPWQAEATALLWLAEEVLVIWAMVREGTLDRGTMQGMIHAIQPALWERVAPGQHRKDTLGSLCADLVPRWDALWTFLHAAGGEPTNNAAERALRPTVLWRKGCYGTQSATGSRFVERMLTVSATCQQHDCLLLPYLVDAITAYWAGHPAPKLLPSGTP